MIKIDGFKAEVYLLDCDEYTAKIYGEVKKGLKDKGTPIPENDIWISAVAIQYGLTLQQGAAQNSTTRSINSKLK